MVPQFPGSYPLMPLSSTPKRLPPLLVYHGAITAMQPQQGTTMMMTCGGIPYFICCHQPGKHFVPGIFLLVIRTLASNLDSEPSRRPVSLQKLQQMQERKIRHPL
ncbi:hypothetical protein M406DRAFT_356175 [Cryphonectria parasitica EP155]|uniref:Uncharacterized protein n=1 Tax=Cryphonectria parasitica (strain ATCC 38755 / EP155) TaxID=660469 RepID=A0A9P4Y309_CRYP1|nr:uncharacterized protein M406DRAFT_356175 [Cryphonectria parasitica EP155]KAF3766042.1 hypothetical protein M406DRAFT_356175 [Cryphonectria parasitica EP155]